MPGATADVVGPQMFLQMLEQAGLFVLGLVAVFILVRVCRRVLNRKVTAQQRARDEAWKRRDEESRRRKFEREMQRAREMRAEPQWPDAVLDHYLQWLLSTPDEGSMHEWNQFRWFQGIHLTEKEVEEARERACLEGLAVHDGRRWRLTRRGRRIFEEYAGDRKRMSEAEKKRKQPSVVIDARGAGTVAHTIEGGVHGTTVNNTAPSTSTPTEVDLSAVLQLVEQLRMTLPEADGLSDLARQRASGDLGEVDRELRAPEEDRDPSRVRAALERLRITFLGVDGLVEVVNQLWNHLRDWFPA